MSKSLACHLKTLGVSPLTRVSVVRHHCIGHVKYFKFIGVLFVENVTWKCHINMVTNKLSKVIGILNRLKHVYPQNALLSMYHSLFATHLNIMDYFYGVHM